MVLNDESENPTVCGGCISFTCMVNGSGTAEIHQNGNLCQAFLRGGPEGPENCPDIEISLVSAVTDPENDRLTIFLLEGRQCFLRGMGNSDIECTDGSSTTDSLQLQVDSKSS